MEGCLLSRFKKDGQEDAFSTLKIPVNHSKESSAFTPIMEKRGELVPKSLEGTPKTPKSPLRKQVAVCVCVFSDVHLFVTPWTTACQAPLSMGFRRQEYWSGLSFPSSGNLLNPGIKPASPALKWILYH